MSNKRRNVCKKHGGVKIRTCHRCDADILWYTYIRELSMLAVKGRYNGAMVILDSKPPIKECDVIVNFPDIPMSEHKQENNLKQILKYRGQDIWEGDIEEMRSSR